MALQELTPMLYGVYIQLTFRFRKVFIQGFSNAENYSPVYKLSSYSTPPVIPSESSIAYWGSVDL